MTEWLTLHIEKISVVIMFILFGLSMGVMITTQVANFMTERWPYWKTFLLGDDPDPDLLDELFAKSLIFLGTINIVVPVFLIWVVLTLTDQTLSELWNNGLPKPPLKN